MITITWVVVAIVALALFLRQVYSKLSKIGINHLPVVPFIGNIFWPLFKFENIAVTMERLKNTFPKDKVVGQYQMLNPVYVIQDAELIKKVTIKDFDHFLDRRSFASEADHHFGRSLINLRGEEWKEMRSTLSPAFTSSKIRLMVPFMVDVGEEMIKVLSKRIKDSGNQPIDVNLKDITSRYANDVIATCAFGLKVESQSTDTEFYLKAKDTSNIDFIRVVKIFLFWCFPSISTTLKIPLITPETTDYFTNVVLGTMSEREKKNIIRHDMINILSEIKRGKLEQINEAATDSSAGFATVEESDVGKRVHNKEWKDTDLVAQAILFLAGGFDTVSTTMSFVLHELAINYEVQEKLVQEINDNDKKNNGNFDFGSIQKMKYMDMVVSETLRMYPPAQFTDRVCIKDYNLGRVSQSSTEDLIIRKGDVIEIPIWTFHRDPQLFPNPQKFDPERFSEQNSHNIKPVSYMPFGIGPRNCIGSRFALCEVKVMLYILLRKIKVTPCERTNIPVKLEGGYRMNIVDGGWVRFQIRQ